jgi:hypothetical protein
MGLVTRHSDRWIAAGVGRIPSFAADAVSAEHIDCVIAFDNSLLTIKGSSVIHQPACVLVDTTTQRELTRICSSAFFPASDPADSAAESAAPTPWSVQVDLTTCLADGEVLTAGVVQNVTNGYLTGFVGCKLAQPMVVQHLDPSALLA